jgi:hypothetical protein
LIKIAYANHLGADDRELAKLCALEAQITHIMEKHNEHGCQEVRIPPEVARLKQ